ncbi:MAG: hypothetical protein ABI852_16760, partial [Gemmatimonadaceae bacterium]
LISVVWFSRNFQGRIFGQRSLSAVSQSLASKPMVAVLLAESFDFVPAMYRVWRVGAESMSSICARSGQCAKNDQAALKSFMNLRTR